MPPSDIELPEGAVRSQEVPCVDPECEGVAEPEQDGDLLFYTCDVCGSEFGYERIKLPAALQDQAACAMGIPEEIRKAASVGMERALSRAETSLGTSIPLKPRSGDGNSHLEGSA